MSCDDPEVRNPFPKLIKLIKEGGIWLIILSKLESVPLITPPTLVAIDRKCCVLLINREHRGRTFVTFPLIEVSFISKCHSSLVSARRAECRFWHGNFVIKNAVFFGNLKTKRTFLTGLHGKIVAEIATRKVFLIKIRAKKQFGRTLLHDHCPIRWEEGGKLTNYRKR